MQIDDVTGGGVVCFEHRGAIPASTHHLTLTYEQADFSPRFDFELEADPAPTAWPDAPIVADGYEALAE